MLYQSVDNVFVASSTLDAGLRASYQIAFKVRRRVWLWASQIVERPSMGTYQAHDRWWLLPLNEEARHEMVCFRTSWTTPERL